MWPDPLNPPQPKGESLPGRAGVGMPTENLLQERLQGRLLNRLQERSDQGLLRQRRGLANHPSALAFCSNDYLGLARDPRLIEALARGAHQWGAGATASHLVCGHTPAHEALESAFADFLQPLMPGCRALSFSSGYLANLAVLTALAEPQGRLVADRLNHASLIDAMRLCEARHLRYQHASLESAAAQLAGAEADAAPALIVTDGLFSMDGDLAPLAGLSGLARRHGAWLVVDDAHGFGVLGDAGRGSVSQTGLTPQAGTAAGSTESLVLILTLGKAAGLAGAVVVAAPEVIEWLIQAGRSYIYTTAAPPALAAAATESLAMIQSDEGDQRRAQLAARVTQLRAGLHNLVSEAAAHGHDWRLMAAPTAIQPLVVGSNAAALDLSERLLAQGLWVPAIRPPTVPQGQARLRISLGADKTVDQVDRLLEGLRQCLHQMAAP